MYIYLQNSIYIYIYKILFPFIIEHCGIFQDTVEHHISPKTKQKTSYKISKS